ncbi:hypothetical protein AB1Y20_000293 [Prymnesium parvum]|uniref:Mitochondrial thiamine pyrophosphate carrier 1 n=1 Tax=Prymnesium parvum TaxID=97485 RepID=A0AB34K5Y0_PRYPA
MAPREPHASSTSHEARPSSAEEPHPSLDAPRGIIPPLPTARRLAVDPPSPAQQRTLRQRISGRSTPPPDRTSSLLLSGGAAGAVSKLVTAPIDRVKIMYQVSPSRRFSLTAVVQTAADIVRLQGFMALWRGYSASIMRDVPYAAILFSTFSIYEEAMCGWLDRSADVLTRALAGCLCGATATCLTYPLDVLRARFAADTSVWASNGSAGTLPKYSSYTQGVREIAAKEGLSAFFAGLRPTLMGIAPYSALSFAAFETIKAILQRHADSSAPPGQRGDIPVMHRLVSGAVSGMLAQTSTYPLHVVRRRMQVRPSEKRGGYASTWHGLRKIYAREGVAGGLYKGLTLTMLKGPLQSAVGFTVNDVSKRALRHAYPVVPSLEEGPR